jgi:hypothetical protein
LLTNRLEGCFQYLNQSHCPYYSNVGNILTPAFADRKTNL